MIRDDNRMIVRMLSNESHVANDDFGLRHVVLFNIVDAACCGLLKGDFGVGKFRTFRPCSKHSFDEGQCLFRVEISNETENHSIRVIIFFMPGDEIITSNASNRGIRFLGGIRRVCSIHEFGKLS